MNTTEKERGVLMFLMEGTKKIPKGKNFDRPDLQAELNEIYKDPKRLARLQKIGKRIKAHNDDLYKQIAQNIEDADDHQVKWYVAHIWGKKNGKNVTEDDVQEFKKFMTENPSLKQRSFKTYEEGIKRGFTPRFTDIAKIMDVNTQAGLQVMANNAMIDMLKGNNKQNVTLMAPDNEATQAMGWKPLNKMGVNVKALEGMAINPDIKPIINAMFKDKWRNPAVSAFETINGIIKKGNLSFALFHHLTLGETALGTQGIRKTAKAAFNAQEIFKAAKDGAYHVTLKNWDTAADFVESGGQLGDITEVQRDKIDKFLGWMADKAEGTSFVSLKEEKNNITDTQKGKTKNVFDSSIGKIDASRKMAAGALRQLQTANRVWDRTLWDYFHNTLKIEGYKHLVDQRLAANSDASPEAVEVIKRETAQLVNDTFGGQNWRALMTNPKMMQISQAMLLSPDWTLSTARQFLSPVGLGSITRTPAGRKARAAMGARFWAKSIVKYGSALMLLNMAFRMQDRETEWMKKLNAKKAKLDKAKLKYAETDYFSKFGDIQFSEKKSKDALAEIARLEEDVKKIEKAKPSRFPSTDEILDLTMFGNSIGHNTEVFVGRNPDGTEKYRGPGKQFTDVIEYFLHLKQPTGIEFDPADAGLHKLLSKGAPAPQIGWMLATSFLYDPDNKSSVKPQSLSGFVNKNLMKAKQKGSSEFALQMAKEIVKAPLPFSWRTMTDPRKDFTTADLATPQRRGASKWTVREGIQVLMKEMQRAGEKHDAKAFERTLLKIRKAAERNDVDFRAIMKGAFNGTFNHLKKDVQKWKAKTNELMRKKDLTTQEKAELKEADRMTAQGLYYIESLRNSVKSIQNVMARDPYQKKAAKSR